MCIRNQYRSRRLPRWSQLNDDTDRVKEFKLHMYHILSKYSLFNIWTIQELALLHGEGETIEEYFGRLNKILGIILYITKLINLSKFI